MNVKDLFDKVLYLNNRVWTVYGVTDNGVFCYQGVKPYDSFQFDSRKNNTINTAYFPIEVIQDAIIEGEEIEWCMKKMKTADNKKLSKQHAIDFFVHLTGHTKSFITKNIESHLAMESFRFKPGSVAYEIYKSEGALLLSHNLHGFTRHVYFDFLTFDHHDILNEENENAYRQQIIDEYLD